MKSVLLSVKPQHVANILNGIKTLEIRKKFPKDYVGWVYIYCCKQRKNEIGCHINYEKVDGKVVARFWCDEVEEIKSIKHKNCLGYTVYFNTETMSDENIRFNSCLDTQQLYDYLQGKNGKVIHITKLEIFDKSKEISEFSHYDNSQYQALPNGEQYKGVLEPLTRAPQSYCFIEV